MSSSLLIFLCLVVWAPAQYVVRRNVKDYGARGDGVTDDSNAIITALTQGRSYNPSTQTPAYVYFPSGTYLVTQTLPIIYYTEMVGDSTNPPTIKFVNNAAIRVLEAEGSWYHDAPQNNFFRQIRNFVIDMTQCNQCTGVHWQVAQATSLSNIYFKMNKGSNAQGMWMENGSGGFFSDLVFEGGLYGIWVGNQQFTSRNITIRDASVSAIYLNWDWAWTFQQLNIVNSPVCIDVAQGIGSLILIDSKLQDCGVGIRTTFTVAAGTGVNSVLLDNVQVSSSSGGNVVVVQNKDGSGLQLASGSTVKSWGQGHVWSNGKNTVQTLDMSSVAPTRAPSLAPTGGLYFTKPRVDFPNMLDVTTLGLVGDGKTDNTAALRKAVNQSANQNVLFFPHGTYLLSDTVYLPPGTRLVGEAWSVLMASGSAFQDASKPRPMIQVGVAGDQGVAQLFSLLFSTLGPQPGAWLLEWNMRDPAGAPGSCGMWDTHFRVGGAIGTNIQATNCPASDGSADPVNVCTGAYGLMSITASASVYMENVWGWTADHDIDIGPQINVYTGRGLLCQSQGPVWMYGTAMEHNVYYQYHLYGAKNILMALIQTETPYYQPSSKTPFAPVPAVDPTFCSGDYRCNMAYALVINGSSNVWTYGAGLYSFFNVWGQGCLQSAGGPSCQLNLVAIQNSQHIYTYALSTYGSVNMLTTVESSYASAAANLNTFCSTALVDLNTF